MKEAISNLERRMMGDAARKHEAKDHRKNPNHTHEYRGVIKSYQEKNFEWIPAVSLYVGGCTWSMFLILLQK